MTDASLPAGPSLLPGSVRACTSGEVAAGGVWWAGATGSVQGGFVLYSIAEDSCTIRGPIALRVVANGQALPVQTTYVQPEASQPIVLVPGLGTPSPLGGRVDGRAQVVLYWANWCGKTEIGPAAIELDLPGLGTLDAPFARTSAPRCDSPGHPSTLSVEALSPQDADE
jgi:hypothetical protein